MLSYALIYWVYHLFYFLLALISWREPFYSFLFHWGYWFLPLCMLQWQTEAVAWHLREGGDGLCACVCLCTCDVWVPDTGCLVFLVPSSHLASSSVCTPAERSVLCEGERCWCGTLCCPHCSRLIPAPLCLLAGCTSARRGRWWWWWWGGWVPIAVNLPLPTHSHTATWTRIQKKKCSSMSTQLKIPKTP